ncbi:hypothetical protein MMC26_004819 [Xylographa opegraphella]|nr:hypothetical protein [Xylographa opegraphella]
MPEDSGLYLNRDYGYWQRIASRDGVAAVLHKWGNPKSQSRNPTAGRTLQDALDAIEAFRPGLNHRDVVAMFKLYEKPEARDIRSTPLTASSGTHNPTSPDPNEPGTRYPSPPDTPERPNPRSLKSEKVGSDNKKSKKVKFSDFVEERSSKSESLGSPNRSSDTHMRAIGSPFSSSANHETPRKISHSNVSLFPPVKYSANSRLIQLYPVGASASDGSAHVFSLQRFLPDSSHRDLFRPWIEDLSLIEFVNSWPELQAASFQPLRWDVPSESLKFRKDTKDFRVAVMSLQAELSGKPEDNIITFYLRPRLMNSAWQAVPWGDGATEILVYDADGPLLPVIQFKTIFRKELHRASSTKLDIMGVQALSLQRLFTEIYDRRKSKNTRGIGVRLEYLNDGSKKPVWVRTDYELHEAIHLLQAQRAQRQNESRPLIFRAITRGDSPESSIHTTLVPESSKPESPTPKNSRRIFPALQSRTPTIPVTQGSTPSFPASEPPASAITVPGDLKSGFRQTPQNTTLTSLLQRFKIGPSTESVSTSRLSSEPIDAGVDNVSGDAGAFTISLDLVDRSLQQSAEETSVQMEEFLVRRFHRSPRPLLYLPFPANINKDNYRLSETLVLEELFNGQNLPGIASLKLVKTSRTRQEYKASKAGTDYPYRGRGPVSSQTMQSSAIDSCLVAARLLDVGRLATDTLGGMTRGWKRSLDSFSLQCLQAIDEPWEIHTSDTSIQLRDAFYTNAITIYNGIVNGAALNESMKTSDMLIAARMWEAITSMASQFTFMTCPRTACVLCFDMPVLSERRGIGEKQVIVDLDNLKLKSEAAQSMGDLLTTYFGQSNNEVLTAHNFVRPPTEYPNVRDATSDRITFGYSKFAVQEVDVKVHRISYRWLGGIHNRDGHRRVYWADADYASNNRDVKIYDDKQLCACIVGGIEPDQAESRVPAYWAEGTELLFYERLKKDNKELILSEMDECVAMLRGKPGKGLVKTISSFFSSPRQNGKRSRGKDEENETIVGPPSSKKAKLESPFLPDQ